MKKQKKELLSIIDEMDIWQTEIEDGFREVQNLIAQINVLKNEIENMKPCGKNCIAITGFAIDITNDKELSDKFYNLIKDIDEAKAAYEIFEQNKTQMEATAEHIDKYYHAKANCEAAELGLIEALWAGLLSILKEVKDYYKKVHVDHQDAKKILIDCIQDLLADLGGLITAVKHGYCSDDVIWIEDIFKKIR